MCPTLAKHKGNEIELKLILLRMENIMTLYSLD